MKDQTVGFHQLYHDLTQKCKPQHNNKPCALFLQHLDGYPTHQCKTQCRTYFN